jgi:hypothetical protein
MKAMPPSVTKRPDVIANRRRIILRRAEEEGLVGQDKEGRIAGRLSKRLLRAAKLRAGVSSDTELLEYALAKVALEDDFGDKLFRHEGSVSKRVDLEL